MKIMSHLRHSVLFNPHNSSLVLEVSASLNDKIYFFHIGTTTRSNVAIVRGMNIIKGQVEKIIRGEREQSHSKIKFKGGYVWFISGWGMS